MQGPLNKHSANLLHSQKVPHLRAAYARVVERRAPIHRALQSPPIHRSKRRLTSRPRPRISGPLNRSFNKQASDAALVDAILHTDAECKRL
jgi:hypothetical protein